MIFLDMKTVIFSHIMTDVMCMVVMVFLWHQNRKRFAGLSFWVGDYALQVAAVILIILRGSIPDFVSIVVSNTFVVTGALAMYMGLQRFVGKISSQVHNYGLIAVFFFIYAYFALIDPDLTARAIILSFGISILTFQCMWLLMYRVNPGMRPITYGVGFVFLGYCLVSIFRVIAILSGSVLNNDFFKSSVIETLFLLTYQMLFIIQTYGLILMISRRLLIEVITQEEKFAKAFNSSPYAMSLVRLSDGRIIEVNKGFIDISGYGLTELCGKSLTELNLWDKEEDRLSALNELSESGKIHEAEFQFRKKSGKLMTGLLSAEIITIDSQRCVLSSINDITQRKQAQKALQQVYDELEQLVAMRTKELMRANEDLRLEIIERKKMEEEILRARKLESVGLLAGGIAHDFNNILTTILGNITMARMQVNSEDELFDLLREAETASTRAQTLTKQLLTFARGGTPIKEVASVKDVIIESSLFMLRGSKSSCKFLIAEDLWPVDMDVGQIGQVINNIVINANQAMPEGGIIQVAAENLIIDEKHGLPVKAGKYVRMSFKDQGVGIAEKHLSNIFDPYFTTKQKGRGLGLSTTYSIIKKHDGHITVESKLGVGTTFNIYLPASDKAVPKKEEVALIKGHGRILVMDDEASLRKMIGRMMEKLDYESEFAKDGAEAIQMYQEAQESEKPYAAVILDLTIPGGMGGKEAIKKLLEIDPEVKAIVSSGYSDDPVLANFQEYGFKGIMPKPFESRSLGKVLHDILKGSKLNIED